MTTNSDGLVLLLLLLLAWRIWMWWRPRNQDRPCPIDVVIMRHGIRQFLWIVGMETTTLVAGLGGSIARL